MIAIEGGTVWNGRSGNLPAVKTVMIEGARIVELGLPENYRELPTGTEKINAEGAFVMPGLINVHTHMTFDANTPQFQSQSMTNIPQTVVHALHAAAVTLAEGITTVRDLGASLGIDLALRNMITDGIIDGPHMLVSGIPICMTGGHAHRLGGEVDGPVEARKAARSRLKAGVDHLKVMATGGVMTKGVEPGAPQLTVEEMRSVVEEAEKAGTYVAAHCHGNTGIRNALTAGIRTIEHGTLMDEETADSMAERGAYLTPTFISAKRIADHGIAAGIPDAVRKVHQMFEPRKKSLTLALERKIPIIIGTDAGTPMNYHGLAGYLEQMKILHALGMPVELILVGATSLAAEALCIDGQTGTIEEGMNADILILEKNPFEDLSAFNNVRMVIKRGKIVPDFKILPIHPSQVMFDS